MGRIIPNSDTVGQPLAAHNHFPPTRPLVSHFAQSRHCLFHLPYPQSDPISSPFQTAVNMRVVTILVLALGVISRVCAMEGFFSNLQAAAHAGLAAAHEIANSESAQLAVKLVKEKGKELSDAAPVLAGQVSLSVHGVYGFNPTRVI